MFVERSQAINQARRQAVASRLTHVVIEVSGLQVDAERFIVLSCVDYLVDLECSIESDVYLGSVVCVCSPANSSLSPPS